VDDRTPQAHAAALLDAALEATHDAIIVIGADRHVLRCNRRYLTLFGLTSAQIDHGLDAITAALRSEVEPDGWSEPRADEVKTIRFNDGRVYERRTVAFADGAATGLVVAYLDLTERQQLEEDLRQSQKLEALGRLAGGVAHDLNNALTAIGGYAELALAAMADGQPRRDVEEVRRAAERAASVTRQLLAFSRKQLLAPQPVNVNTEVAELARMLGRLVGPTIELRTRFSAEVPEILADPGQFEQAVLNLAVNARDAMPSGGTLTLTTSFEQVDAVFAHAHQPMAPGDYVVVGVEDTGHGMDAATKARIFEPFFTTKGVGKGTGLGLSMVYGTVKQSGGFIYVDSEVGRGTTFRMFFPPAPLRTEEPAPPIPTDIHPAGEEVAATLLVVEDEPSVRRFVASSLESEPYRLLLAESAEDAMAITETHHDIDLLITDVIMPGKSGIELASLLVSEHPGLEVIVMSGYTDEALQERGLTHDAGLLHKPFTPRELRERVRDALAR
jgi:signal transduction histidine kinase/CheY-like chemotaxis protein